MCNIIRQVTLNNISKYKSMQETLGENLPEKVITNVDLASSKDIYGQDKLKLKSSETSRYFECENCGRKIAGGRFAQHINKCLERKRR